MSDDKWEIGSRRGDPFTTVITLDTASLVDYEVTNKETGETKKVTVWNGTEDEERQQVGEQIAKGNFNR